MKHLTVIILVILSLSANSQSHRDSLDITHYTLNVDISNIGASHITGCAELQAQTQFNISDIYLDLFKLTVDSAFVNGTKVEFLQNDTLLTLQNYTANAGEELNIKVYYGGNPKKDPDWGGFFFTNGIAFNMGVGMGSYPHGIGRYWYPCLDSFTDKATYDFYIKTSEQNNAVCGGVFIGKTIDADNKPIYHWKLNQPISTYLSSVAVGPFVKISDTYNGIAKDIPIEYYVIASDSAGAINTFSKVKETAAVYESLFGSYEWDRIGFVVVPFSSGAMEHATNIAYPHNSLSGSLANETLAAHEFSHSWFGNQVTTATSEDMWLNEGWATYCEVLFKEFVYSKQTAMNQVLSNHKFVITKAHVVDGGYYPLNQIPHNITYGKTVYDKGADVVHSLRGYLGDSLFFKGVKYFLQEKKYENISSQQLESLLTEGTGIDMSGFFDNWVYQTGFPHYSVDSFYTNGSQVTIALRQKLNHRENYGTQHRVPITLIDNNWNKFDTVLQFNGQNQLVTINSPINAKVLFVDYNHTLNDATTHDINVITETGYKIFSDCDFKLNTKTIQDSALIQVTYNYVLPDPFKQEMPGVVVSNYHYWKIDALLPNEFMADGKFTYKRSQNTNPDIGYTIGENDTIVLLYRKNMAYDWIIVKKGGRAQVPVSEITRENVRTGEYAFGYWDGETPIGISERPKINNPIIFPNPVNNLLYLKWAQLFSGPITIFDQSGKKVYSKNFSNIDSVSIPVQSYTKGIYYISFNNSKAATEKIIVL